RISRMRRLLTAAFCFQLAVAAPGFAQQKRPAVPKSAGNESAGENNEGGEGNEGEQQPEQTNEGGGETEGAEMEAPRQPGTVAVKPGGQRDAAPGEVHTVVKGDTLWDLSQHYLGNPWYWPKVWSYN